MTSNNHCSLKISINQENKIKVSILNDQNQEKIIKLNQHDPDWIPITISFNMNEINKQIGVLYNKLENEIIS